MNRPDDYDLYIDEGMQAEEARYYEEMEYLNHIKIKQIKLMKHTLGLEHRRIKRGIYKYYRNYFCAGSDEMKEFEDLIAKGMATKDTRDNCIYYFLTNKGIAYLSETTNTKIVELD